MGSLRVRVTALATLAVAVALLVAGAVQVWTVERTTAGQVREAARAEVDRVAEAVAAGDPVTAPEEGTFGRSDVLVVVQDESGEVIETLPSDGSSGRLHALPEGMDVSELGASLHDGVDHRAGSGSDRLSGHVEDMRISGDGGDLVVASRSVSGPDGTRTVMAISPLAEVARSVEAVNRALWMTAPLLLLFVAATAWAAVDRSLRPVERIRRQADAISHSTLSGRLPEPDAAQELSGLTGTLNEMLERLETGARRQREFIADASHELRTPLAAIRSELEVALAHPDTTQWEQVARRLLGDQRRLQELTSDLLTLARLEETGAAHDREPTDLAAVVAAETDAVAGIEIEVETRLESALVRAADADLIRMVRNLVDNAVRYANRIVAVEVQARDGWVVLTVDDDGPGIPESDRERVFERFTRLDASRTRTSGGVGIGLALVQRVVEAHGGRVVASESPLGGARFEVVLPRA